jgi:hypothetical protein
LSHGRAFVDCVALSLVYRKNKGLAFFKSKKTKIYNQDKVKKIRKAGKLKHSTVKNVPLTS